MNKYNYLLSIAALIIVCFTNCKQEKEESNHLILKIDKASPTSFYDLFERIEIIDLETNEQSLIRYIDKVTDFDEKIFIFDELQYALFVFDSSGKYLHKIHRIGQGPGEYTMVYDVNVDKKNKRIEMLDPNGFIQIYDFEGKHEKTINLPKPPVLSSYHCERFSLKMHKISQLAF